MANNIQLKMTCNSCGNNKEIETSFSRIYLNEKEEYVRKLYCDRCKKGRYFKYLNKQVELN